MCDGQLEYSKPTVVTTTSCEHKISRGCRPELKSYYNRLIYSNHLFEDNNLNRFVMYLKWEWMGENWVPNYQIVYISKNTTAALFYVIKKCI